MKYNIKKRNTSKDLDYSNSSRVFRPLASRTCLSNVRTESSEECFFSTSGS